ncbi:MAG: carbon-nitrogen hydrolase family protein [Phycisphaerae bacterium]
MKVAIAQIAPVLLDRHKTTEKIADHVRQAGAQDCRLVAFGESLTPAYPLWISRTDGAKFESSDQKDLHAMYLSEAIDITQGHLDSVCTAARETNTAVIVGIAEKDSRRGGQTIFCTRVFIDQTGTIASTHRKLMPTYEERLAWGTGDGAGLVTHPVEEFTVGALNCWENWMPLARTALYAAGENLHVMIWPGDIRLTQDITRFAAKEGRSFVLSASAIIREQDIPNGIPHRDRICRPDETIYNGGSCIAGPDGEWIVEPIINEETMITAELDLDLVRRERQNFDATGHYSRPDVLKLHVDRRRQNGAEFTDE